MRYVELSGKMTQEQLGRVTCQINGDYPKLVKMIKENERCLLKLTETNTTHIPVASLLYNVERIVRDEHVFLGTDTITAQVLDVPHRPEHMYVVFSKGESFSNEEALSLLSEGDAF